MKKIILNYIPLVLFILASNTWGAATAVPGKPFEYLANLSQSSNTPVLVSDANNNEVGTFLGLGENQTRVMLGLTGSVEGQVFSFVVGAEKSGFDASGRVTFFYPWIEGGELDQLVSICTPYNVNWSQSWVYSREDACGQALVTYINNTNPCDQAARMQYANTNASYSVGGFFERVLISEPGATVYRLGNRENYSLPYGLYQYTSPSMVGIDANGECGVIKAYANSYSGLVPLYPFDKLGNLYDTYTPPFQLIVQ